MNLLSLSKPTVLKISGRDRLKWFHNFTTNEIRKLDVNHWCETFITDSKGKTFSHGIVWPSVEHLYFLSVGPNQTPTLIQHLDRYIISEDVELVDASDDMRWQFTHRLQTHELLQRLGASELFTAGLSTTELKRNEGLSLAGHSACASGFIFCGFALPEDYLLIGIDRESEKLLSDIDVLDQTQTRAIATANHWPWFGIDFGSTNLPQEIDRDALAISFHKGCYLGQETIARLDAMGQVQKKLMPLKLHGDPSSLEVETPQAIFCGDVEAGMMTSACRASENDEWIGMAMMKRKFFKSLDECHLANHTKVGLVS